MVTKKRKKVAKKKTITRRVVKKRVTKRRAKKQPAVKQIKEKILGTVTHYFPKVRAAVIKLKTPLSLGDVIKIKGHTTDFTQTITSMQIDHVSINSAKKGDEIGLLVESRVRQHDVVCKP
jgi:hypothetical protein